MKRLLLAILAILVLAGCGEDGGSGAAGGNGVDRAFVADMIPHHESAVEMGGIAQQRGKSAFVRKLADDIVRTQRAEIVTLRSEDEALASTGVKPGSLGVPEHMMGMDDDPAALRTADPFDRAFLEMMIPHHEGAIVMAKAEIAKGADPELKSLAQQIIDAQQREIAGMRAEVEKLGGSAGGAHGSGHSG